VPPWAVVDSYVVESVERDLSTDGDYERAELDAAFTRFERAQPYLAQRVAVVLAQPLDETALALGYFLTIAVWLVFERGFGSRLAAVTADQVEAVETALEAEEDLRASHADEPIDFDDVVAAEQPSMLAFVHEHVEAALDVTAHADEEVRELRDVDVDDVHAVYRSAIVLVLSLSYAVRSPTSVAGSQPLPA
jgi:hypothetical protein